MLHEKKFLQSCWIITPDSSYSIANAYIYTIHMSVDSTSDYSYSYMTIHIHNIFTIFTYCIILTDYIPTIPPLIQRGASKPEHVSESFKLFSSKHFGEDVCNLIICGTMSKMDCLGLYMMLNQMILYVDVFSSIMESRILIQLDCRSIGDQ